MSNAPKVCLIDDDEIYQFTMTRAILQGNLSTDILCFYDGINALKYLQENRLISKEIPDIILLDINMPQMDGWEFIVEFKKIKPLINKKISLYFVSSSVDLRDINKSKEINEISDYFAKPMQLDQLNSVFKKTFN